MSRSNYLDEIRQLDPIKDHQRIVFLNSTYEFPFDTTRALEFALFRTFAIPSISTLLDRTGEFHQRPQKRYDDTDLIISEIYEHGYDSERGRAALRRMNQQHGRYAITNDDFLYVMSTFVFEPIRWNARFGWRKLCEQERLGVFYFWREVGQRMNIKAIPETYEAFEAFNIDYERKNFVYSETNRRVGLATCHLFLSWVLPRRLHPLGMPFIYAMLDDALLTAFGFPKPPKVLKQLLAAILVTRGRAARLLPSEQRSRNRTALRHRSYPKGYTIEQLGPPN